MMVWDRECSQSKDKWGKLHGSPRVQCAGEYYYAEVHKRTIPTGGANDQSHGL